MTTFISFADINKIKDNKLSLSIDLGGEPPYPPTIPPIIHPANEIWYTSKNETIIAPVSYDGFGANYISNTYEDGKGVIKFDNAITTIPDNCWRKKYDITSLELPSQIDTLPLCFAEDTAIVTFDFTNIKNIGHGAFYHCVGLTSITLNNVETIDYEGFGSCSPLSEIFVLNDTFQSVEDGAFNYNDNVGVIHLTDSMSRTKYKNLFRQLIAFGWSLEGGIEDEPITQPNDEIWYTTSDNDILHNVTDSYYSDEGAILVSHTYDGVKGVLKFSGNVTKLPEWFACNSSYTNINLKTISFPSTLENMGGWAMQCCWDLEEIKFNGTHCFTVLTLYIQQALAKV